MLARKKLRGSSGVGLGSKTDVHGGKNVPQQNQQQQVQGQQSLVKGGNKGLIRKEIKNSSSPSQFESKNSYLLEIIPTLKNGLFSSSADNIKARELRRLLSLLSQWGDVNDGTLLSLLEVLKENVESLDEKMTTLVHSILDSDWCGRSGRVTAGFEGFLSELVVIRPFYAGSVLQSLVKKLLPLHTGKGLGDNEIAASDQKVFSIAHRNLQNLMTAFPRLKESLVKTLCATYPYMGKSPYIHFCYVANLIQCAKYLPAIKSQIFQLLIHKLSRIDVNIPREELELLQKLQSNLDEKVAAHEEDSSVIKLNPLVEILDCSMNQLFQYLQNEELEYDTVFQTFENEIVKSFGVNNVQFIYFYLINLKPEAVGAFLDFCWKKATCFNTSDVIRVQFMAYLSGVLTRSNCVSVKILKRWLSRMSDWAGLYVDQRVKSAHWSNVNIETHGPFYAVCQAIFYVFAFRNKDLVSSRKCTAFTGTLNLGRLVTCDLNPLKAVVEPVAIAFVNAAHIHQISYCRTVLERNQSRTIGGCCNTIEGFFPFDPLLLRRSAGWIEESYRVYEPYLPEVKIEKEEKDCSLNNTIDMELSCSFNENSNSFIQLMEHSGIINNHP